MARWPTASPTKISTGAKRARASPARLTKTLPADAPATAAAAEDAGAADEGPAPAAAAATEDAGAAAAAPAAPAAAAEDAGAAEEGPAPADDMVGVLGSTTDGCR